MIALQVGKSYRRLHPESSCTRRGEWVHVIGSATTLGGDLVFVVQDDEGKTSMRPAPDPKLELFVLATDDEVAAHMLWLEAKRSGIHGGSYANDAPALDDAQRWATIASEARRRGAVLESIADRADALAVGAAAAA